MLYRHPLGALRHCGSAEPRAPRRCGATWHATSQQGSSSPSASGHCTDAQDVKFHCAIQNMSYTFVLSALRRLPAC